MLPFLKRGDSKKTIGELEEDTERLHAERDKVDAELSVAEKREAIRQLKERGLTGDKFGWDFKRIKQWLSTH